MKKNKGAKLLFVFALLALLIVVYIVVIPKLQPEQTVETEAETEVIAAYKTDDLTSLSYTYAPKDISLSFRYKSTNYTWYLEGDENFPVDQTTLNAMATAVVSISADRKLGADEISRADAGLDAPDYTITAKYGGNEYTYYIGSYNSFTKSYYFAIEGDDSVYMIPSGLQSNFQYELLGLAAYETIPTLTTDTVSGYDVVTSMLSYTIDDATHIGNLASMYISSCIEYNPTDESKANYMLDSSASTITIHYSETKAVQNEDDSISATAGIAVTHDFVIKVGALVDGDDSKRYVMLNDSPLVYTMSASLLETLMTQTAE